MGHRKIVQNPTLCECSNERVRVNLAQGASASISWIIIGEPWKVSYSPVVLAPQWWVHTFHLLWDLHHKTTRQRLTMSQSYLRGRLQCTELVDVAAIEARHPCVHLARSHREDSGRIRTDQLVWGPRALPHAHLAKCHRCHQRGN